MFLLISGWLEVSIEKQEHNSAILRAYVYTSNVPCIQVPRLSVSKEQFHLLSWAMFHSCRTTILPALLFSGLASGSLFEPLQLPRRC